MAIIVRPDTCRQADALAKEMLLPEEHVKAYLTLNNVALDDDDSLLEMASYFAVPVGILVERLNEVETK